eukprot:Lithocolla_globosa_v1_NODE_461_length_3991_cov_15.658283.p1 type:complete len:345 gc:universal NODE_461_length_3991_cov_15.658283:1071-2105(+)
MVLQSYYYDSDDPDHTDGEKGDGSDTSGYEEGYSSEEVLDILDDDLDDDLEQKDPYDVVPTSPSFSNSNEERSLAQPHTQAKTFTLAAKFLFIGSKKITSYAPSQLSFHFHSETKTTKPKIYLHLLNEYTLYRYSIALLLEKIELVNVRWIEKGASVIAMVFPPGSSCLFQRGCLKLFQETDLAPGKIPRREREVPSDRKRFMDLECWETVSEHPSFVVSVELRHDQLGLNMLEVMSQQLKKRVTFSQTKKPLETYSEKELVVKLGELADSLDEMIHISYLSESKFSEEIREKYLVHRNKTADILQSVFPTWAWNNYLFEYMKMFHLCCLWAMTKLKLSSIQIN